MKKSANDLTRLELLYADEYCIGLHKEPGIPCQSRNSSPEPLDQSLVKYLNEPIRLWTRIDQPVSGLVLFYRDAFNPSKHTLTIQEKSYLAIVEGHPTEDRNLVSYLSRDGRQRKSRPDEAGRRAELSFTILHRFDHYTLLNITPTTGRFHQIRQQLAHIGHPVKGDVKYGARRKNADRSIHLHALQYIIRNHKREPIQIYDPSLPDDSLWSATRSMMESENILINPA